MAREFAQIKLAIWADDDWRDLSPMARYLYLTLLTSPTLTHCGVADWRPSRIGSLNGMTVDEVEAAGEELSAGLYLVIDTESEEVLIRSFLRNDGLMKQPKMAVAMASAHAAVASQDIRGVIVHEAKRLHEDRPDLNGWGSERAKDLLGLRSINPSTLPTFKGSGKGKPTPFVEGSEKGSPTPAPTPTTTTSSLSPRDGAATEPAESTELAIIDRFEEFWETYGHKVDKQAAEKKWRLALKKPGVTADMLIAAAAAYVLWERTNNQGGRYIMGPAKWLLNERWTDERPARPPLQLARGTGRAAETSALLERAMARAEARERGGA